MNSKSSQSTAAAGPRFVFGLFLRCAHTSGGAIAPNRPPKTLTIGPSLIYGPFLATIRFNFRYELFMFPVTAAGPSRPRGFACAKRIDSSRVQDPPPPPPPRSSVITVRRPTMMFGGAGGEGGGRAGNERVCGVPGPAVKN